MNTKEIWKDMWYKTCNQIVEINNKVFVPKKSLKRLTKLYKKVIVLKKEEENKKLIKLYSDIIELIFQYYKETSVGYLEVKRFNKKGEDK